MIRTRVFFLRLFFVSAVLHQAGFIRPFPSYFLLIYAAVLEGNMWQLSVSYHIHFLRFHGKREVQQAVWYHTAVSFVVTLYSSNICGTRAQFTRDASFIIHRIYVYYVWKNIQVVVDFTLEPAHLYLCSKFKFTTQLIYYNTACMMSSYTNRHPNWRGGAIGLEYVYLTSLHIKLFWIMLGSTNHISPKSWRVRSPAMTLTDRDYYWWTSKHTRYSRDDIYKRVGCC